MSNSSGLDLLQDPWPRQHNASISNNSSISAVPTTTGLYQTWYQVRLLTVYAVQAGVASLAVITNLINVTVFLKAGVKDSVTVSFFGLSGSDLMHTSIFTTLRMLTIVRYELGIQSQVLRLQDLAGFIAWIAVYFMDVSMFITVYVTFQKCCCIAFPFTFKSVFTVRRSVVVMILLYVTTLTLFLPHLSHIIYFWLFNEETKHERVDWVAVNNDIIPTVWRWMMRITLTLISQVIVIVCVVIITAKLRQSVRFRQSNKSVDGSAGRDKNEEGKLGLKEVRAIQAVRLITVIFIVTTLPASINSLATVVYPALDLPKYQDMVLAVVYFGITINASLNIFVYLKYNRRYRNVFKRIFLGAREE